MMKYLRNEPLKKHTSFRIGGPAEYFCQPHSLEELKQALLFAREKQLPVAVIGAGTNLLVLDRGFKGLAIKLVNTLDQMTFNKPNRLVAGAGLALPRLIKILTSRGLGGLEFLAGVPGTLGGAIIMNAGAWGKSIGDYIEWVRVVDLKGNEKNISGRQLGFKYRSSRLQTGGKIVIAASLKLRRAPKRQLKSRIKEYLLKRRANQPLGIPNCGSIFKNPKQGFAGQLIEAAGFKGMRIGDAQVSSKHANFIVNLGEAKAKDVIKLMSRIKSKVTVKLEPEIRILLERHFVS